MILTSVPGSLVSRVQEEDQPRDQGLMRDLSSILIMQFQLPNRFYSQSLQGGTDKDQSSIEEYKGAEGGGG